MKKLVFKEWLECLVVMVLFIGMLGIGFSAIVNSQVMCLASCLTFFACMGLLALFGRTF